MSKIRTALLPCLLIALGCCSSSYTYLRVKDGTAVAEQRGGGPAWVAWYRGGEIVGAAAADDPGFPLAQWLPGTELIDHPTIPRWRRQLKDLQTTAGTPDARVVDLVRAATDFPFDTAVAEACSTWVGGRADRAGELLLHCGDVDLSHAFAEQLAASALRSKPDDGRIAGWLRLLTEKDHDDAVHVLLADPAAGPRTAEMALQRLDEYASRHRAPIFAAAAARLVRDPAMADVIVVAADKLLNSDETGALASLLGGDAPPELARQVLRHLDARSSSERARLFEQAAEQCYRDPRGQHAIARALANLPSLQRLDAARAVVKLPDVPESLVVRMVDLTDSLRSSDREEFLSMVLDGPTGSAVAVRDACEDAARRHLPARARERILEQLARQHR